MIRRIITYCVVAGLTIAYAFAYTFCEGMQQIQLLTLLYDVFVGVPSAAFLAIAIEIIDKKHENKQNKKNFIIINIEIETKLFCLLNACYNLVVNCYNELKCLEPNDEFLSNNTYDCLANLLSDMSKKVEKINMATISVLSSSGDVAFDIKSEEIKKNIQNKIANEEQRLNLLYDKFLKELDKSEEMESVLQINNIASEDDVRVARIIKAFFPHYEKNNCSENNIDLNDSNYVDLNDNDYFKKTTNAFKELLDYINQDSKNKNSFYIKYLNNQKYFFTNGLITKNKNL